MKEQPTPLEIVEYISLACTAAGTVSVVLLSQHVGYAIGPGAISLVLGAANRRRLDSGQNYTELVQVDQKLSADLASVRQKLQGFASSSDYNRLKSTVQSLSTTLKTVEQHAGASANVGIELNPIRQDIVQLRSQYGRLQELVSQLGSRMETIPGSEKLQNVENELDRIEEKFAQTGSAADLSAVTAEIEALKEELNGISPATDIDSLVPELQTLKGQVEALENTSDRLEAALTEIPVAVKYEELEELQQRLNALNERFELQVSSVGSVETKDGQIIELSGVEDSLAKIAGAISEHKEEMDSRMESLESVDLKMIQEQLLDQQETLSQLQTEYQNLLAYTSEGGHWGDSLSDSDSEYSQKIAHLERALANTMDTLDRLESSPIANGHGFGEPEPEPGNGAIDADLSVFALELQEIGILKGTVSQLAGNLENLENQVQWAIGGGTQPLNEEIASDLQSLKENLNRLETAFLKGQTDPEDTSKHVDMDALTQEISQIDSLREKIANLECHLANTTDTIDRIESFLSTKESPEPERQTGEIDVMELSVLASEIAQIGILQTSLSELAGHLEHLEQQVQYNAESDSSIHELREEIDVLKASLEAVENWATLEHETQEETVSPEMDINILSQELQEIGILKDTVYQLSGHVEILDEQVHSLATASPDSITGQLKEEIDALMAKEDELSEAEISGDLMNAYESVMLRLDQVEAAYLDLEAHREESLDLNSYNDAEISDQFTTLNAELSDLQQDISGIGQQLMDLEQGVEGISGSDLEAIRQNVSVLDATVDDVVNRLENDFERTDDGEKVQELEEAFVLLETKFSMAIAQLDDGLNELQLQTNQLTAEQAETQAATNQIEEIVGKSIDEQMGAISQLLQDVSPCDYELVFDRPAIYDCLASTIENSKKQLTIVCPWLNRETMSELLEKLEAFLERNGQLQLGWGHLADINAREFPILINQQWHTEELTNRRKSYDALNDLEALREKYPDRVEYKVLGTHENFLVSDNSVAIISSHHFLSSDRSIPEREVALKTSSMKIIQGLMDRFKDPMLKPGNADAYYNRGFERLELGDSEGAMADYTRAMELSPNRSSSYNNLALTKYYQGDVSGAIADYSKALELDADEPVTYFNRAVAYYKIGKYRKSITDYTQVIRRQDGIRISAESTGAYFQRGEAYRQLGEYDSAISDYSMAIRLTPNHPVAYNNRGLARYNKGDYLGSIKDYSEALELKSDHAVAYSNRGVSRLKSGDYAGAIGDFDSAIALQADCATAYNNRGLARFEMGDRIGAIVDLEKAAELFAAEGNVAQQKQTLNSIKRFRR